MLQQCCNDNEYETKSGLVLHTAWKEMRLEQVYYAIMQGIKFTKPHHWEF